MRKVWKKGISFALAVSMLASSVSLSYADEATDKSSEAVDNKVEVLSEAKYDEAITFTDSVAMVENGTWSTSTYHRDENWNEVIDSTSGNVSTDTNIVFVDGEGNETVISNKGEDGETIFDAVYPMISNKAYRFDALKIIKDNKISYIKADGTYYGGELKYYTYAVPMSSDMMLVSDDMETMQIINDRGEVVVDGIEYTGYYVGNNGFIVGDYLYYTYNNAVYVFNNEGNYVTQYDATTTSVYYMNSDCVEIHSYVDGSSTLLNGKRETIIEVENGDISAYYPEWGYVVYYGSTDYLVNDVIETRYSYKILDMETNKILSESASIPNIQESVVYSYTNGVASVKDVYGKVYIADVDAYVQQLGEEEGYESVSAETYFVNRSLIISMIDANNLDKANTFVLTEESGYKRTDSNMFEGIVNTISYDDQYFVTCDANFYVKGMYSTTGIVVKEYASDAGIRNATNLYKYHNADGKRQSTEPVTVFPFAASVYNGDTYEGVVYIKENGGISQIYDSVRVRGNFVVTTDGDVVNVVNTLYRTVYSKENVTIENYWYRDCFNVIEDGRVYLYDVNGKLLFGEDAEYTAIGMMDDADGVYSANEYDSFYMRYANDKYELPNGLCVTRTTDADGVHKYGLIRIGEIKIIEDEKTNYEKVIFDKDNIDEVIKENERKDVVIKSDNDVWFTFEKGSMKEHDDMDKYDFGSEIVKDFDKKGEVPEEVNEENFVLRINYKHSGKLPGRVHIRFFVGRERAGEVVHYSWIHDDNKVTYMQSVRIDDDGYVTVEQDHCSDYVLTTDRVDNPNYGDANGDGKINVMDAVLMKKYIAGFEDLGIDTTVCDLNEDIKINVMDAVKLLKHIAGFDVIFGEK